MWVADPVDDKLFAYDLSSGAAMPSRDIDLQIFVHPDSTPGLGFSVSSLSDAAVAVALATADNHRPVALWSDGVTIWVSDDQDDKLYAYDLATGDRAAGLDFETLAPAGNSSPKGIWSDGATMWVADNEDRLMYRYPMPQSAVLKSLALSDLDFGLFAAGRLGYTANVPNTVASTMVDVAAAFGDSTTVTISPADADTAAEGHQVDLRTGANVVTVTVTSTDGRHRSDYRVQVNRASNAAYGWNSVNDFDALSGTKLSASAYLWSDGTTLWVADSQDLVLYAYDVGTRQRTPDRDIDSLKYAGIDSPRGIWSDGHTMWVADHSDPKVYAFDLATGGRRSYLDFDNLDAAGNDSPVGMWSDGDTMWIADISDDKVYAYDLATRARESGKDIAMPGRGQHWAPAGLWSDGTTMWVADWHNDKIYAYDLATGARRSGREFNTLKAAGNRAPSGLWSDGETMWVYDQQNDNIFAYNMPAAALLGSLTLDDSDIGAFNVGRTHYTADVTATATSTTVTATAKFVGSTVAISPAVDADPNTDGHQVNLSTGTNTVTVTVTKGTKSTTYTITITQASTDTVTSADTVALEWDPLPASEALASGNETARAIWSDGTTMWVADHSDDKIYAYSLDTSARIADRDIDALGTAGNTSPKGIWSNGSIMWVADNGTRRMYAYDMP